MRERLNLLIGLSILLLTLSSYTQIKYSYNNFDNFFDEDLGIIPNHFFGNWGPLIGKWGIPDTTLGNDSSFIGIEIDKNIYYGNSGNSLKLSFHNLTSDTNFTGVWQSIWRHSDSLNLFLDFTKYDSIEFFVRGSGLNPGKVYALKVEIKDYRDSNNYQAFQHIPVFDDSTNWQRIVLCANVSTGVCGWRFVQPGGGAPDRQKIKFLNFIIEGNQNPETEGTFYIDNISFIDVDEDTFLTDEHSDEDFLNFINERAFHFFPALARVDNGLIPDRASFSDLFSVAGAGFGITSYVIGANNGWIDQGAAFQVVEKLLQLFDYIQTQQKDNPTEYGVEGFFYHFLEANGKRKDDTELSTIDTALLLCGALTAGEYFGGNIKALADSLFARVNWEWFHNPDSNMFYLGWKPADTTGFKYPDIIHSGFFSGTATNPATWNYYTDEVFLINLLAVASPRENIDSTVINAWKRESKSYSGYTLYPSWPGTMFTYFFADCWVPFDSLYSLYDEKGFDWFANDSLAALASRQFCINNQVNNPTLHEFSWGLTACETGYWAAPTDRYKAWGALPAGDPDAPFSDEAPIAPYGTAGAILFTPDFVVETLKWYYENTKMWHHLFGFIDAYNVKPEFVTFNGGPWHNYDYYSIDVGPFIIMIDNYLHNGFIQRMFSQNQYISEAYSKILPIVVGIEDTKEEILPSKVHLYQNFPNPFNPTTTISYDLPKSGKVTLKIYDLLGQEVITLIDEFQTPGSKSVVWNGKNSSGEYVSSGVFFYNLETQTFSKTMKLLLIR